MRFGNPYCTKVSGLNIVTWDTEIAPTEKEKLGRDGGEEREHENWEIDVRQLRSERSSIDNSPLTTAIEPLA
ncbi:hypothetical protein NLI96_g12206 [Meripilus lineatus]|uniref:Uncharacterized protein n=1 Tax=Meripilus lineatus TaxID=2056292 RepID=A0AAD5USS8_9APHY|nr:hypothetical protein NLI96_g12206 [Physisporinus lineatus]